MAKVIGIDIADKCGWAVFDGDEHQGSGVWDFSDPKRWHGGGMCFLKFRNNLSELAYKTRPDAIYFEEVRRHLGSDAARKYYGYVGNLMAWCEKMEIPFQSVPVATIKIAATGKGNASKDDMLAAAREHWPGVLVEDDNQADAMWCGVCGIMDLQGATT